MLTPKRFRIRERAIGTNALGPSVDRYVSKKRGLDRIETDRNECRIEKRACNVESRSILDRSSATCSLPHHRLSHHPPTYLGSIRRR